MTIEDDKLGRALGFAERVPVFLRRASVVETEPGYREYNEAIAEDRKVRVFLDGIEQAHCEAADADAGWVRRAKLDEEGKIYAIGDEIARETVHGAVIIKAV